MLEQFKQFYPHVTNRTIVIRGEGWWMLSANQDEVKFTGDNLICAKKGYHLQMLLLANVTAVTSQITSNSSSTSLSIQLMGVG